MTGASEPRDTEFGAGLLRHAGSWLDEHGEEPLPWTRLTAEPGRP